MGVLAVDLDLGEQWESYAIGSVAEGSNLRVRPRFLMAELVAWEGKDFKAARLELFVEALQAVVLWCEATFRGDIDNQQYLTTIVGERALLARAEPGAEIVDRRSGFSPDILGRGRMVEASAD